MKQEFKYLQRITNGEYVSDNIFSIFTNLKLVFNINDDKAKEIIRLFFVDIEISDNCFDDIDGMLLREINDEVWREIDRQMVNDLMGLCINKNLNIS